MPRSLRLAAAIVALGVTVAAGAAYSSSSSSPSGYVVQPGDSLWAIAASHGTTVAALASANHLDPSAILLVGKVLVIPGSTPAASGAAPSSSSSAQEPVGEFCSSVTTPSGPYGALPSDLASSPQRRALAPIFARWAAHYGVPVAVLEAIGWQESGWQEDVVSPTGAVGVGQIEPYTASFISSVLVGIPLNPQSVNDNIRMSAAFLAYLYRVEGGSRCRAIAAYYEGPLQLATRGVFTDTQQYVLDVEALVPRFGG